MANEPPKSVGQAIGEGFREGTKQRMTNYVGGSGGGGVSNNSYSGGGHYGFVIIVAFFLVIVLFGGPLYAECEGSGFCETRIKEPIIEPVVEALQDTFGFVSEQTQETRAIIAGEQTFSWASDVESRDRTGVWFDNERTYGINLGEDENGVLNILGTEFGAIIDIVVGKMDEDIKELNAELECSLGDVNGKNRGAIATSDIKAVKLFPPSETEKTSIHGPYDCVFTSDQIKPGLIKEIQGKPYFSEDIVFNLTYSLNPTVSMPVFVIQDKGIYDYYRGRLGDAFEDLANGKYSSFSRGVPSQIQYDSEVQAVLQILNQPLYSRGEALIGVQFKNKDIENIATIRRFSFALPNGVRIGGGAKVNVPDGGDCDWFIGNNLYEFNLNNADVIRDLKDLNRGSGDTRPFLCKVEVDESALRGDDLSKLGDIEGELEYSYTISEIVKISN